MNADKALLLSGLTISTIAIIAVAVMDRIRPSKIYAGYVAGINFAWWILIFWQLGD